MRTVKATILVILLCLGLALGYISVARSAGDPVLVAAGDICSNTTNCGPTAALIDSINPDALLTLGDNAYQDGSLAQFNSFYKPHWGRHDAKVFPSPGNHEYGTANAQGYRDYFGARAPGVYYSYNLGAWHVVSLASTAGVSPGAGGAEETWLKADLAANPSQCLLVYWHEPRFSSGTTHGNNTSVGAIWNDLYAAGADVILNGHEHNYERFAKQNPSGVADPNGIREFVVGTGGTGHYPFGTPKANSQVRNSTSFGVMKMTLHPGSYDWQFVPVAGQTFTDSGTDTCSGGAVPPPTTTGGTTTAPPPPPPTTTTTTTPPPPVLPNIPAFPVRATFFYPWFPEAWNQQGLNPFTKYHPSLGFYDSGVESTITQQVRAMEYGKFQVAISSWWGQGTPTDTRLPKLLSVTNNLASPLKWATYYEPESTGDPTSTQLKADLTYIRDRYASDPAYARVNGKFVVFAFAGANDACGMADRWKAANTVGAYVVLKVFSGYKTCASQPDSWHQYAPAIAEGSQAGYAYYISPGFNKANESTARLTRDLARWNTNIQNMNASTAPWKLVTTFNEWGEGSSVESATEWATPSGFGAYLDALHNDGVGPPPPPPPPPVDTTAPTAPGSLQLSSATRADVAITWAASSDAVGVTGYRVYLDGVLVATKTTLSHDYGALDTTVNHVVGVEAFDAAGNVSTRTLRTLTVTWG